MKAALNERVADNVHIRDLFSLKERVALVTGGAGRYGRQICRALAEAGATVIVASRNCEKCGAFAEELQREGECEVKAMRLDVTDEISVEDSADQVRSRWGRLDILFNNAVSVRAATAERHSTDDWGLAMESNATALYRMMRVFGEMMAQQGAGSVVNIASIYGVVSPDFRIYEGAEQMTNPPSYGFAKAGMIQLTRYFAVLYASRGVRVNCISPGGLFSEGMPSRFVAEYEKRTPMRRMGGPNDLKGAALFLASDASSYVTGQNLIVDGGYTAL
jgi:NAD(P)-dependent dehydrogenase (short-subunit alcohol dehydrogenase family)